MKKCGNRKINFLIQILKIYHQIIIIQPLKPPSESDNLTNNVSIDGPQNFAEPKLIHKKSSGNLSIVKKLINDLLTD